MDRTAVQLGRRREPTAAYRHLAEVGGAAARRHAVLLGVDLWMYRLDEGERGNNAPRKGPGRGVAIHRGADGDTIFVISPGYQLIALDALR